MFLEKLKDKEKEFGGELKSSKGAKKWFDDAKKGSKKSKNVVKWSEPFTLGKLYSFKYNPIHKDTLWYFDKEPLIICINKTNNPLLYRGINLNYLPKEMKWEIVSNIRDKLSTQFTDRIVSKPFDAEKQKGILIPDILLNSFNKYGLGFAIRSYYINRMKDCYTFCYEDWLNALFINNFDLTGINEKHLEKLFNDFLIKNK